MSGRDDRTGGEAGQGQERLALLLRMLERLRSEPAAEAPARPVAHPAPPRPDIVARVEAPASLFRLRRDVAPLLRRSWTGAGQQDGAGSVLHVTSAESGEGVSTLARELARAAAAMPFARPLLVDCRRGETDQSATLGAELPSVLDGWLDRGRIGVAAIAVENHVFHACTLDAFAFRPALAEPAPEPATPRRAEDLHHALRAAFNVIILDCPPVLEAGHVPRLGSEPPEVLLVVAAESTRIASAMRARDEVLAAGARLAGVVMNRRRRLIPALLDRHL